MRKLKAIAVALALLLGAEQTTRTEEHDWWAVGLVVVAVVSILVAGGCVKNKLTTTIKPRTFPDLEDDRESVTNRLALAPGDKVVGVTTMRLVVPTPQCTVETGCGDGLWEPLVAYSGYGTYCLDLEHLPAVNPTLTAYRICWP